MMKQSSANKHEIWQRGEWAVCEAKKSILLCLEIRFSSLNLKGSSNLHTVESIGAEAITHSSQRRQILWSADGAA
jgi:hypothetical protein